MSAAILETSTLAKVVLYSVVSGVGIAVIFGAGVSSAAAFVEAMRERRSAAGTAWALMAIVFLAGALAAVVLGLVVMSTKS